MLARSPNQLPDYQTTQLSNADRRSASLIGRHARLELAFRCRHGRTVLAHAYAEPPFRIGRSFDIDGALYLMIVCAGPGVFAGDDLRQIVTVERSARVLLASQSSLQVHPGPAGEPARVRHEYTVEDEGELHCHWDPIIPFTDARVAQRFDLQLSTGSRLYWSDALMSGRCGRGEAWTFSGLAHELRLNIGGALQYLERYDLRPADRHARQWAAGGANYIGTSLVYHRAVTAPFVEGIQRRLDAIEHLHAGLDLVEPHLVVGRLLASNGPPFSRGRGAFRDAALAAVFERPELVVRR